MNLDHKERHHPINKVMRPLSFCCFLFFGSSNSALGLDLNKTAVSGQTTQIKSYRTWDKNCQSRFGIVKLVTKPQHGKLTTRIADGKIRNNRLLGGPDHCFGTPIKTFKIDYTSVKGFRGVDTFTVDITFGSGRRDIDVITVTVQ
jgi:hypothetical protein